jgi:NADH oxidase (H2O2-forming)
MKVVVIGNGVAGASACSTIRKKTKEIRLTLISEEPFPLYSPCVLPHYISKEIKRSKIFLKCLRDYEKERIHCILGHKVEKIDPSRKMLFSHGQILNYDKLILATGARPIIPSIEGIQKKGVRVFKSLKDAERIISARGRNVVVIGSGLIGVQLAMALCKRRWEVCLVEVLDWILPNLFDERASSIVKKILEGKGIKVLTGTKVLGIEGKIRVNGVVTDKTGKLKADMVVMTVGMQPNVDIVREAGIKIGELGGILTNDSMETNIRDIFACGDCVEGKDPFLLKPKLSLLWPQAERQGKVAGYNSIGEHCSIQWTPDAVNLDVFGTFAGAIGQPARALRSSDIEIIDAEKNQCYHSLVILNGRLVGAQFIGNHEGMGILFPLIGKNCEGIFRKVRNDENLVQFPWYYSIKNFLI